MRVAAAHLAALVVAFACLFADAASADTHVPRIGVLWQVAAPLEQIFREAICELGYEQGRNVSVDWRITDTDNQKTRTIARELTTCDVIVTSVTVMTRETLAVTKSVPVVFVAGDPVATGFVASLARPGG